MVSYFFFQYIRVSATVKIDNLYQLITKEWKLEAPPIIISVIGGGEFLNLQGYMSEKFQRSLITAAETTGDAQAEVWISNMARCLRHFGNDLLTNRTQNSFNFKLI